jgi:hypothetical protein
MECDTVHDLITLVSKGQCLIIIHAGGENGCPRCSDNVEIPSGNRRLPSSDEPITL